MHEAQTPPEQPAPGAGDLAAEARGGPRSPIRTLRILDIVAESHEGIGLGQLSQRLDIPKTSLFNMLRPLVTAGYLLQIDNAYILGPETLRLSFRASRNSAFLRVMRPTLELCASRLGETVAFVMLEEAQARTEYMDVVEANRPIRYVVRPGEVRPLYCTAAGLAILAWQPTHQVQQYLRSIERRKMTPSTEIDSDAILARLQEIRRTGTSVTLGEYNEEICGIAAPVFCRPNVAFGAITAGAPIARALASKDAYVRLVKEAAESISMELVRPHSRVEPKER
ncbi:IclR family transcriptional regulator [Verticiella sediminum]